MSRHTARSVLEQFDLRPAMVAERYAGMMTPGGSEVISAGLLSDVRELSAANLDNEIAASKRRRAEIAAAYGATSYVDPDDKPFIFYNGYAIIPIHGVLINRFAYSWSFVTGYNFIRNQVAWASADPDVLGIIYDVNSNGGMVSGCKETADIVRAASKAGGGKPSLAVVDANCYSAAYMIACAADSIAVTPTGGAGSIGVVMMHMDISAALEKAGVKVTFIFAGDHKVDGNAYEPLSDDVKKDLKAEIDKLYGMFVTTVATNRGLTEQAVRDTQARCYLADDALAIGLVDSVAPPPEAMERFFTDSSDDDGVEEHYDPNDELDPDDEGDEDDDDDRRHSANKEIDMTVKPNTTEAAPGITAEAAAAASATAANEARANERARIGAILSHPEAEGRTGLANHLAMETDMGVEAAAAVLKASPKQDTKPATSTDTGAERNHFKEAMDKGKHPNAGSEGGPGDGSATEGKPNRSAEILGAMRRATGKKEKATA